MFRPGVLTRLQWLLATGYEKLLYFLFEDLVLTEQHCRVTPHPRHSTLSTRVKSTKLVKTYGLNSIAGLIGNTSVGRQSLDRWQIALNFPNLQLRCTLRSYHSCLLLAPNNGQSGMIISLHSRTAAKSRLILCPWGVNICGWGRQPETYNLQPDNDKAHSTNPAHTTNSCTNEGSTNEVRLTQLHEKPYNGFTPFFACLPTWKDKATSLYKR